MIHLEKVVGLDYRKFIKLSVSDMQKKFVSNNSNIFAKAYAFYDQSMLYGIYNDETPVGMALVRELPECSAYTFDQFMIDEKYQGRGYGRKSAELILDDLKNKRKYNEILLCYIEEDEAAKKLYMSLGFEHNGVVEVCDDGTKEIVMALKI